MATTTVTTYDGNGNVVEQRTVEVPPEVTNRDTVDTALAQAMTTLATVITRAAQIQTSTFSNNTQRDQAIKDCAQGVEVCARAIRRLVRHARGDYSGSD